jgi:hypothetical protein
MSINDAVDTYICCSQVPSLRMSGVIHFLPYIPSLLVQGKLCRLWKECQDTLSHLLDAVHDTSNKSIFARHLTVQCEYCVLAPALKTNYFQHYTTLFPRILTAAIRLVPSAQTPTYLTYISAAPVSSILSREL